ncbi:MAG: polysaccharide deacetylase family protein [Fimbriimonas sp.]
MAGISAGCSNAPEAVAPEAKGPAPAVSAEATKPPTPPPVLARVSNRPANEKGSVLILEYHHINQGKGDMFRTPEQFANDLERLYKMGFRPVTVSQYLDNKMDLAPGASPVVMTFDDSNPSQFQLLKDDSIDPSSGIGIWKAFADKHPDFPIRATFYVLPDVMWGQPALVEKKVAMLREWGSELGNHTVTHPQLKRLSDEQVKKELAGAIDHLEKLGEKSPVSLALPFGISPKNKALLQSFTYGGKKYEMKAAMLVGADPAPAPGSEKLNRYRIPRIQAYPGPSGSDYWLGLVEKGQLKVYVAK